MPSFDFTSEVEWVSFKNAIDVANRQIANRYDFKGTSAKVGLEQEKSFLILWADSEFQIDQVKSILYPELEKKIKDSTRRLEPKSLEKVSGDKVKQAYEIQIGIDQVLGKKIIKLLKDSKLKVQASIQGDAVRVSGAKRDNLQEAITLIKGEVRDYPISAGNFRN